MNKYIDAEKLYEYLEEVGELYPGYADNIVDNVVNNVIGDIKTFIASNQQEQSAPQYHWKPSKEQMKALNAVANEGVLLDLFNDLLKLF